MSSKEKAKVKRNDAYYRIVRKASSNLISVWREFVVVLEFLQSQLPYDQIMASIPELVKDYLQVDNEKIEKLKIAFNESLEQLKEIDVALHFKVENSLYNFNRAMEDVYHPIANDVLFKTHYKQQVLIPFLFENIDELSKHILTLLSYLPEKESKEIEIEMEQFQSLAQKKDPNKVPLFIVSLCNQLPVLKEVVTDQDIKALIFNPTVQFLMTKIMNTGFARNLFKADKPEVLKAMVKATSGDTDPFVVFMKTSFNPEHIESVRITPEEEQLYFVGNKQFHDLILWIASFVIEDVPDELKKIANDIFEGRLSVAQEWEKAKSDIIAEFPKFEEV